LKRARKKIEEEMEAKAKEKYESQIQSLREELGRSKKENIELMGKAAKSKG